MIDPNEKFKPDLSPLTEQELKRAEILYAKYKVDWADVDQQTRLRWITQMILNAPEWQKAFRQVWVWFYRDFEQQEAQRATQRIEAEARAQKAKAEAEAKARKEWAKDAAFIRKYAIRLGCRLFHRLRLEFSARRDRPSRS